MDKIIKNIDKKDEFYFIHSFMAQPSDQKHLFASYDYVAMKFQQ